MDNVPPRPPKHPTKWLMAFDYFDKTTTSGGLGTARPFDTKEEAHAAAVHANRDHSHGGITVITAYAFPPIGDNTRVLVVDFQ